MPTVLPTHWPASVTPSQALGYLLARHVPAARLPDGLRLVREAAGWLPPTGLKSPDLGMHQATVRSWMYAARDHARILGPPPGLAELLAAIGDGQIRPAARARATLEAMGAEELADLRTLAEFADWCGADVAFVVLPLAVRRNIPADFVAPEAAALTRARRIVSDLIRRYGIASVNQALAVLADEGLRIDAGNDAQALRDVLDTGGYSGWLWPRGDVRTPLTNAMLRIRAFGAPVPISQIPIAAARIAPKRGRRTPGVWPLPVDAVRAWVNSRDDWRLTSDDEVEPVGPVPEQHLHDRLLQAVLTGKQLDWSDLHDALVAEGLSAPTASGAIYRSPILRRTRKGYFLIGRRDTVRTPDPATGGQQAAR